MHSSISANLIRRLNGTSHRLALNTFMLIVVAHWAEHVIQAIQIWVLGWPRTEALGLLGVPFPWLIKSESLHYGYALVMLLGLWVLRHAFVGRGRRWWMVSFWIQAWHHLEHFILLLQAAVGANLFGRPAPVSIAQLIIARVELHLLYNALVFVPMVVAVYFHLRPSREEFATQRCSCHPRPAVSM
ncbi:hypothetical protein [Allorhizocola rhizosphaerae]|uniref:hypothetical protein n=1 Tax=Allorhizocola rhizosphaerae TaxID=1872709 RepID=UPI000E3BDC7F|nr:hypothetical protein [Allorhizocola rhizosphaerae]